MKRVVGWVIKGAAVVLCAVFSFCGHAENTLKFGIDVLKEKNFEQLKRQKIGLLTHAPATDSDNVPTYEVFLNSEIKDNIVCFFSPEHGLSAIAKAGEQVENKQLGDIPVYSLYKNEGSGKDPKWAPAEKQLKNIDTLVVDLCDVGVRCYTYITYMRFAIEQCVRYGKKVIVLDRPNPLGRKVSGSFMDENLQGYVGGFRIPHLHGMTIGEIALFLVKHYQPHPWLEPLVSEQLKKTPVKVVEMENYRPNVLWSEQKFKENYRWHPPSPNLPTFNSCLAYSCMIPMQIYGNFNTISAAERKEENSEAQPFCFFYPYHPNEKVEPIIERLNAKKLAGVEFKATQNGETDGILLNITDWEKFAPDVCMLRMMQVDKQLDLDNGRRNKLSILSEGGWLKITENDKDLPFSKYANNTHRQEFWTVARNLIGEQSLIDALSKDEALSDKQISKFLEIWKKYAKAFEEERADCLLY